LEGDCAMINALPIGKNISLSVKMEISPTSRFLSGPLEIRLIQIGNAASEPRLFSQKESGEILFSIPLPLESGFISVGETLSNQNIGRHFRCNPVYDINAYQKVQVIENKNTVPNTVDRFSEKVRLTIEHHMSNPNFNVDQLCRILGMPRSSLYRKTVAITGISPVRFILKHRLHRAARLFENKIANVSEVAKKVGFTNYSYFARCFKQMFNQLPSHYRSPYAGKYHPHSIDDRFLREVDRVINNNIAAPKFGVDLLCKTLLVGRSTLYRKLSALVDQTPAQHIRSLRLERAKQLLCNNSVSITTVAFEVGFCSASYFTRCFREKYECLPSEYRAAIRQKRVELKRIEKGEGDQP
jgi:AraC-like DNA-binding protein